MLGNKLGILVSTLMLSLGLLTTAFRSTLAADGDTQIMQWVDDLGSSNFQERREAFLQLWRTGESALSAVQSAMASNDAQQKASAATLDLLIRMNVPADDPQQAAEFIQLLGSNPQLAISRLCEKGHWEVAYRLLDSDALFIESIQQNPWAYSRILNAIVDEAIEQENLELAWPLARRAMPVNQALWVARKLGLPGPPVDPHPIVQAWQDFFDGNVDRAIHSDAPPEFRAQLALRAFQWESLAKAELLDPLSNGRGPVSRAAIQIVLQDFVNNRPGLEDAWRNLLALAPAPGADPNEAPPAVPPNTEAFKFDLLAPYDDSVPVDPTIFRLLTSIETDPGEVARLQVGLMMCGQAKSVQEYLMKMDPNAAWTLCLQRGDYGSALKAVGIDDISKFKSWITKRREELNSGTQRFFADLEKFQTVSEVARVLLDLGYTAESELAIDQLASVCRGARQSEEKCWTELARAMYRAESRFRFLKVLEKNLPKMSTEAQTSVLRVLYPDYASAIMVLFETAPTLESANGGPSRLEALEQLWLWNRERFEPNSSKALTAWIRKAHSKMAASEDTGLRSGFSELAELCKGLGLNELAIEILTTSDMGGADVWSQAAELLLKRGQVDAALGYLSAARKLDGSRQEAIVDEASALMTKGRQLDAEELQRSRWMRPIAVYESLNSWYGVASRLHDAQRDELAREYIEPAFRIFGKGLEIDDDAARQTILVGLKFADICDKLKDREGSSNARRAVLLTAMNDFPLRSALALYTAAKERVDRAVMAARTGDTEAFRRHAYISESLQPMGIEIIEETYADLVASGNKTIADETLRRMEARMLAHLEQFPKDATGHNNLAWMYARCDQNLDEALSHARVATELAPHSAVLLDTLAEVHFRRGELDQAIAVAQRCIALDPREAHLREQLDRFLRAKTASTNQDR